MTYFLMVAYNSEKTLKRSVESILSQTSGDLKLYICDHASTDSTGEIIREYSRIDKRVHPYFAEKNDPTALILNINQSSEIERNISRLMFNIGYDDWFSRLDADDDYEPDFLKEMIGFAKQEQIDFAACRSNYIFEPNSIVKNEYVLKQNLVMTCEEDFDKMFTLYFRFMGTYWGKLQKGSLFKKMDQKKFDKWLVETDVINLLDTAMELYFLKHSQRAGVCAKLLHNYHIYPKGLSAQNLDIRVQDHKKMPEIYRNFLISKVGYVSEENERFIQEVYERSQMRVAERIKQRESNR